MIIKTTGFAQYFWYYDNTIYSKYVMVSAIFSNNDNSVGYMFNVHIASVYVLISREG